MANAAAVLESVQPGQNYSFFRSAGGSPLCAAIDIAYGALTEEYLTSGFATVPDYNGHAVNHSREVALDRDTGALFIFDSVLSLHDDLPSSMGLSYGPLYHTSSVLRELAGGVGLYFQRLVTGGSGGRKSAPYVLSGDRSGEWSQRHHVFGRWAGDVTAGQPVSFMTAIVPFSAGAVGNQNLTAADLNELKVPSVDIKGHGLLLKLDKERPERHSKASVQKRSRVVVV